MLISVLYHRSKALKLELQYFEFCCVDFFLIFSGGDGGKIFWYDVGQKDNEISGVIQIGEKEGVEVGLVHGRRWYGKFTFFLRKYIKNVHNKIEG